MRKKQPRSTYGDALRGLRQAAQSGVQEAIEDARSYIPPPTRDIRRSHVQSTEALFDGVVSAVANSILRTAMPGSEEDMARLVSAMLIRKVQVMGCVGHC